MSAAKVWDDTGSSNGEFAASTLTFHFDFGAGLNLSSKPQVIPFSNPGKATSTIVVSGELDLLLSAVKRSRRTSRAVIFVMSWLLPLRHS